MSHSYSDIFNQNKGSKPDAVVVVDPLSTGAALANYIFAEKKAQVIRLLSKNYSALWQNMIHEFCGNPCQ